MSRNVFKLNLLTISLAVSFTGGLAGVAIAQNLKTAAQNLKLDSNQSTGEVKFTVVSKPGLLKIHGTVPPPTGEATFEGNKLKGGHFVADLSKLDTGIEKRDEHTKKYLETDKFPTAEITITSLDLKDTKLDGAFDTEVPMTGKLKVHGVEKEIQEKAHVKRADANAPVEVSSDFVVILKDYGIATPEYMNIKVSESATVEVNFKAPLIAMADAAPAKVESAAKAPKTAPATKKK